MTDVLFTLALILLFVLANGVFVAAEFAIVGAPRSTYRRSSKGCRSRCCRSSWG